MMRQTPGGLGVWDGIKFTHEYSRLADVVIVLNALPSRILGLHRKGGLWLMSQEPPHDFYRWQTEYFPFFDQVVSFWPPNEFPGINIVNYQTSLPWHVNRSYDELCSLGPFDLDKQDAVSWITSNLNTRPGHSLRLEFMQFLHDRNFSFDLFGRGFVPIEDKFDGIAPYKYSIAVENYACNDYWTEKIADCYLSWTMPIYYGCSNILEYFPERSMLRIDPRHPEVALRKIEEAVSGNLWNECIPFIAEARQLILDKYQFFPAIAERIKTAGLARAPRKISSVKKIR